MKNFYDFIVTNIKMGHWVAVRHKDGDWKVFMYVRPDGEIEGTSSNDTIEESLEDGLLGASYPKQEIEEEFTTEYKIVTPAPKLLQKGTKVEVLESYKEYATDNGIADIRVGMAGKKGFQVVAYDKQGCYVHIAGRTDYWNFPTWAIAPIYELENTIELSDDELIAELEKRGRLKDKKVID